jgi:hypothetical protein
MDKIIRPQEEPLVMVIYESAGPRRLCHWHENGKVKTQYYSRWLWEKVRGKIPKGYFILYKDNDTLNDSIENYEIVPSREYLSMNRKQGHIDGAEKYSSRWSCIDGITDLEKLNTVLLQYDIRNFQQLNELTGIDLGQLSRIKNQNRGLGFVNIKRLFDAMDKINIV